MNQRKQAIIAKFDQLPANSKEFVMACMTAIIDRNPTPLQQLRAIHAGDSELCALLDEAVRHVQRKQSQTNTESYTDLNGAIVVPPCMDWLEDGWYWSDAADERFDDEEDEPEAESDQYPCSRYCIGVDESGDGISVWLNCDMQEVEV